MNNFFQFDSEWLAAACQWLALFFIHLCGSQISLKKAKVVLIKPKDYLSF
jgi:hypothetical protein